MRVFRFVPLKQCLRDKIGEDYLRRACGIFEGEDKLMQDFCGETRKKKYF